MSRKNRRAAIGAVLAALTVGIVLFSANAAYSRSGDYFQRAGFISNCLPSVKPPATAAECASLANAPDHLDNMPLTDESLALA